MKLNVPNILVPTIVGLTVYIIVDRFFTEKVEPFENDPLTDLRVNLVREIIKKILKDRAFKIALISSFATAGVIHFQLEIETLLVDDVFTNLCIRKVDGELKIVCDIIEDHQLNLNAHTNAIKSLIVSKNLSQEQKISLLKIKLDFIINGECEGKTRFLVVAIIGTLLTFTLTGVGGLAIILEALYRLFQEGRIGKALYKQILKALVRRKIPIEHLLD